MARSNTGVTTNRLTASNSPVTGTPLTIACWFNPANLTAVNNLVFLYNTSTTEYVGLIFDGANGNGQGDNVVLGVVGSSGESFGVSSTGGTAGTWMHCAAVFTSGTSRTAYRDGVAGTTNTASRTPASIVGETHVGHLTVSGSTFSALNGSIAETAIWDAALTASEIASLAKGASPLLIRPANLVRFWPITGRLSPEPDAVSATALTLTGTMAQVAHPYAIKRPQDAFVPVPDAGGGAASAAGVTVTEQESLVAGSATGAASAPAATVSLTTAAIAAPATGAASAAASTVTEQESLSTAGSATGAATGAAVTVTEQEAMVAGSATGASTAAAATVSLSTSLIGGTAGVSVTAAGATVTETAAMVAGAATGAASAAAVTVTEQGSLIAGAATGAAARAGVTVTEQEALSTAGTATGAATAAAATVSLAASLLAGSASAGGSTTASGVTVSLAASLIAGAVKGEASAPPANGFRSFPNALNTGVRPGVTLTASGGITVDTDNAVISGKDFSGTVRIAANNVIIRDCRISADFFGILHDDGVNPIVEYCEFIHGDNGLGLVGTIRYCNIHGTSDGIKSDGGTLIHDNYIHDLGQGGVDEHNDGIQMTQGSNVTIRHNTILMGPGGNSAVFLGEDSGPIFNVLIEDNYVSGGNYTLVTTDRVTVTNNLIGSGQFGWSNFDAAPTWAGNVDTATNRYVDAFNTLGADAPVFTPLTVATSFIPGSASVGAGAPGATVSETTALIAGAATGAALRAGVTVSEAASLVAGSAVGGTGAPGATVTETTSFIAGARTGAALASGATITETASLIAGAAFGPGALAAVAPPLRPAFDATSPTWDATGATFDQESTRVFRALNVTLLPGSAVGLTGSVAGATLTSTLSLIAGAAVGNAPPVVAGATVSAVATLIAGAASGAGTGTASGKTVTAVASLVAGTAVGSGGTVPKPGVAPPPRRTFDQTDVRWDSAGPTFDEDPATIVTATFALLPGTAVISNAGLGKTLTATVSLIAGAAVGDSAPVAAGATITAVTTFLTGTATSSEPATVSGAEVTARLSLLAGSATGAVATSGGVTFDASLPTWDYTGVTFDATTGGAPAAVIIGQPTYSFLPGTATGMVVAAGVTFQTTASFIGAPANVVTGPGTASGATVTALVSFEPGRARGQGWATLPEPGSTWTNVAKPGDGWTVVPSPGGTWDKVA